MSHLKELDRDVTGELKRSRRAVARPARRRTRAATRRVPQKGAPARILDGIEQQLGRRMRGVLERLDVPSREDIETITARIVDLERTIFQQLRAGKERLEQRRMSRRLGNRRRVDG
jgi:hypothetical protein